MCIDEDDYELFSLLSGGALCAEKAAFLLLIATVKNWSIVYFY